MASGGKFSVAFWNVENFWGRSARASEVSKHLKTIRDDGEMPDVISLCEIKDKGKIRDVIKEEFSDYDFALTDTGGYHSRERDKAEIEILVGWRQGLFNQAIFTQRVDLKAGAENVRPGALLNVRLRRTWYSLLFLHMKSKADPSSYRMRRAAIERLWRFKAALNRLDRTRDRRKGSRLLVMGDLNTMGNGRRLKGHHEVANLKRDAKANGMVLMTKEHDLTFGQGPARDRLESNLDHVLTSRLQLRSLGYRENRGAGGRERYRVAVRGWNQLKGDRLALRRFEKNLSDHSTLYVEVA